MIEFSPSLRLHARRLRIATLVAIALIEACVLLAAWALAFDQRAAIPAIRIQDHGIHPLPGVIELLLTGLFIGIALFRLARMLGRVEAGAPFGAAADLRGFALYLFLSVLVSVLASPLTLLAVAMTGDGGPHRFAFDLSLGQALMLLVTGLLFFVARLLDAAQALSDEHSQIV